MAIRQTPLERIMTNTTARPDAYTIFVGADIAEVMAISELSM